MQSRKITITVYTVYIVINLEMAMTEPPKNVNGHAKAGRKQADAPTTEAADVTPAPREGYFPSGGQVARRTGRRRDPLARRSYRSEEYGL
jgi:hypothetical protein